MDYEKGAPRNLVQFSEYNDLAFTDTGVQINDNTKPSKNVIWSSEKIQRAINDALRGGGGGDVNVRGPAGAGVSVSLPHMSYFGDEYYPNGYKRYLSGHKRHLFRVLRPSWWLSFIIPSRQHYCDKCCNYMEHTWSTQWKDNPRLNNYKCDCGSKCGTSSKCSHPTAAAPK